MRIQSSTHYKTFKFRLYPTKAQEALLLEQFRLCRNLYNAALEERKVAYKKAKKSVTRYEQDACLKQIKAELPEYKGVYSQVLQDVLKRLDKAFQAFFRRIKSGDKPGYPRFQGRDRFDSICYPQSGFSVSGKTAFFSKIGNIRIKLHRAVEGKIKTATIKREGDEWYAVYACEVETTPLPATSEAIGIDVGTVRFFTSSDGEVVDNPKHARTAARKLRVAQRSVARKKNKCSNRRRKAVKRVAKLHRRVARQRLDFHHKEARKLIAANDIICHEDLNVGGMGRSNLAYQIHDVGWGQFFNILSNKAEEAGRTVIRVNPAYTSQRCNQCGHTCRENRRNQAEFKCVSCGHADNADHNAALNILELGLEMRAGTPPSGHNVVGCHKRVLRSPGL